jgi:predicted PurR-regulated permease PerM
VDQSRPGREAQDTIQDSLIVSDSPPRNADALWAPLAHMATFGIFLILFIALLYLGRTVLLPVFAAGIVALTLAPLVKAVRRHGVPPWVTAVLVIVLGIAALSLALTAMAGPISEWIGRAPEIWAHIKEKFAFLEQPLAAARQLQTSLFGSSAGSEISAPNVVLPMVAFLTPAAGETLLFFATLFFFLAGQIELRARFVSLFADREAKLRFLRIMNDIEKHLTGYLVLVSIINATLGVIVGAGAFLLGFPNPAIFGVAAAVLNYIPYVGPAVMVVILFGVGLVTFPSLGHALLAPLGFIALTTAEGHFITPTIVGRRITLNPLLVFLALAFWTWLWGPIGAFLAAPLSIIGLVVFNHLFPQDDAKLPD